MNMELLENIYNLYNDDIIAITQVGSSVVPYINNPHDMDIAFYMKDTTDKSIQDKIKALKPNDEDWFFDNIPSDNIECSYYIYQKNFEKNLFGEILNKNFNIFHIEKNLKKYLTNMADSDLKNRRKICYHVLILIYIFENKSYDLTEEQIKNIQLCHDRKMTDEIYDFIYEKLNSYKTLFN